jgi:hypothetical protein
MTETVVVPDPEPDWERALQYQGGKRNPAQQYFTFEEAIGRYRLIAVLKVKIEDIARRLRLMLETGHSEQLGPVNAAFFSIRRTGFAIHRYGTEEHTLLSLFREEERGPEEVVDILLDALGVDWRAVATVANGDGRDRRFLEPVLDNNLRPTFAGNTDEAEHSDSGT